MNSSRLTSLLLVTAIAAAACTPAAEPTTTTTSTTAPTPSTSAPTTSTATLPETTVSLELANAPVGLDGAVLDLYAYAADPSTGQAPDLPTGLITHLADLGQTLGEIGVSGSVTTGQILESQVAVVVADEDVVLAVADQPGAWRIVGARLSRFDKTAWYGDSPRLALVIGSDARPGQDPLGYRADSLHLIGVVPATGQGAIVGIPRDSWVEASYGGKNKITNMMASRGPEVVLETARNLTGLPLEGYLITGFLGFSALVDEFGGFEFDVPYAMAEPKSGAFFQAGLQLLTGPDALAFARNRSITGGDFTRSLHQGQLMVAALGKSQTLGIEGLPRLLELFVAHAWTDLPAESLLTLAASSYELDRETLSNVVVDGQVGTAGSASVVYLTDAAFATFADLADGVLEEG
ncbi:MAG: LCP family protein [Acidimicrobiia bacterium]